MPGLLRLRPKTKLGILIFTAFLLVGASSCLLLSWMWLERDFAKENLHSLRMAHALATLTKANQNGAGSSTEVIDQAIGSWPGVKKAQLVSEGDDLLVLDKAIRGVAAKALVSGHQESLFRLDRHIVVEPLPRSGDPSSRSDLFVFDRSLPYAPSLTVNVLSDARWGLLAALCVGAICSWILTRHIVRVGTHDSMIRSLGSVTRGARMTVLEMALAALTAGVFIIGFYGLSQYNSARKARADVDSRTARLTNLRLNIETTTLTEPERDVIPALREAFRSADEPLLWSAAYRAGTAPNQVALSTLKLVGNELEFERSQRFELERLTESRLGNVSLVFVLAAVLSFGSMMLVRAAVRQQEVLAAAQRENVKNLERYRQLAENLPIGLFIYQEGKMTYTNATWDAQCLRDSGDLPEVAFERCLMAEDRARCLSELAQAERKGAPFEVKFRLIGKGGQISHMLTCGVPIHTDGDAFDHLLGFTLDITANVIARQQVEQKASEVEATNNLLRRAMGQLEDNIEAVVHSLVRAVEAKDPYTAGHSERVMGYAVRLGERLGLTAHELRVLEMGTLVHDVGKIGIPDAILTKPDKLTAEEFAIVREHPLIGDKVLSGVPMFEDCLPIVLSHHERIDGSGYPHKLRGDEIPFLVQIASVADTFDAMTSTRAYRVGMALEVALEELHREAASGKFDSEIVRVFADMVKREGILGQSAGPRRAA